MGVEFLVGAILAFSVGLKRRSVTLLTQRWQTQRESRSEATGDFLRRQPQDVFPTAVIAALRQMAAGSRVSVSRCIIPSLLRQRASCGIALVAEETAS